MDLDYFNDHLFDLINESELLDLRDIVSEKGGFRVTVGDGSVFMILCAREKDTH